MCFIGFILCCIVLKCVSNVLPHSCLQMFWVSTYCSPVVNYNLNNKHTVDLIPHRLCHAVIMLHSVMSELFGLHRVLQVTYAFLKLHVITFKQRHGVFIVQATAGESICLTVSTLFLFYSTHSAHVAQLKHGWSPAKAAGKQATSQKADVTSIPTVANGDFRTWPAPHAEDRSAWKDTALRARLHGLFRWCLNAFMMHLQPLQMSDI